VTVGLIAILDVGALVAQNPGISLPPSGDNQRTMLTQQMGAVTVTVDYSSPNVTGPSGEDRRGRIWGALVPWGMAPNNFGAASAIPWRAGANENTVLTVSHDVRVQGQPLAAGSYGLHMVPQENGPWTVIFSNDTSAWGSFFYDSAADALRVEATPEPAPFHEWLSYDFIDRQRDSGVLALSWEELRLPLRIEVPDQVGLYVAAITKELRGSAGFGWQNWNAAAAFLLGEGRDLEQALAWADAAISLPFVGNENVTTLATKAQILSRLERKAEAAELVSRVVEHPTADATTVHQLGRGILAAGDVETALVVFEKNFELHDGVWPTHVGLMRAYSAAGDLVKSLEHARKALAQAPDALNKSNLERLIAELEQGKPVN
jgi:tetratricopeptide (TPR) repeat protein